jgi:Protein of unknown function (DUF1194)
MRALKQVKLSYLLIAFLTAFLVTTGLFIARKGLASEDVDLVLLLALDVSASIDDREYRLMKEGLAQALMSKQVDLAIRAGKSGAIAISIMQWSGFQEQEVKIQWTRVAGGDDLMRISSKVRRMTRRYNGGATDIGGAINFSRKLINSAPFLSLRKVIDVAGDGPNNVNSSPAFERDITVKSGITINGLAIVGEAVTLAEYYSRFVIGGNLAFVENARDYDSFEIAMRRKLLREIGSLYLY